MSADYEELSLKREIQDLSFRVSDLEDEIDVLRNELAIYKINPPSDNIKLIQMKSNVCSEELK